MKHKIEIGSYGYGSSIPRVVVVMNGSFMYHTIHHPTVEKQHLEKIFSNLNIEIDFEVTE